MDAAPDGDQAAFAELVRRTHADTFTLARRLVSDDEDAREVVQEAYLRAFRSIRRFRGDAQFTTWLYRITANCASTHLGPAASLAPRTARRRRAGRRPPPRSGPGAGRRRRPCCACGWRPPSTSCPARLRAVVVLRDIYDLNHAEIADELGISESAAKVRLHRARRRLRAQVFPARADDGTGESEEQARAV